jgi:hypothetical protein
LACLVGFLVLRAFGARASTHGVWLHLFVWTFMVFDIVKREKHETLLFVFPA